MYQHISIYCMVGKEWVMAQARKSVGYHSFAMLDSTTATAGSELPVGRRENEDP